MRAAVAPTFGLLAALTACASNPARQAGEDCALTSTDSSYIGGAPLYLECAVDTPAEAVSSRLIYDPPTRAASPPQPGVTCHTAEVEFVVGVDGRPELRTMRLVRTDDHTLGQALLRSVPGWTYSPALLGGGTVRQLVRERRAVVVAVTVTSSGGGPPPRPAIPLRCR